MVVLDRAFFGKVGNKAFKGKIHELQRINEFEVIDREGNVLCIVRVRRQIKKKFLGTGSRRGC